MSSQAVSELGIERKGILWAERLLIVFILAMLVAYRSSPGFLIGAVYLVVASNLEAFGAILRSRGRMARERPTDSLAWNLHLKRKALTFSAWQVAIIALLNLSPFRSDQARASLWIGYLLVGLFAVSCYSLVGISDDSRQQGGSKPLNYFGRPRSRRIFFCGFVVVPILALADVSFRWPVSKNPPLLLRVPQFWVVMTALLSFGSAMLVFLRHRKAPAERGYRFKGVGATALAMALTGAAYLISGHDLYIYLASSATMLCIAAEVYCVCLAREKLSEAP